MVLKATEINALKRNELIKRSSGDNESAEVCDVVMMLIVHKAK